MGCGRGCSRLLADWVGGPAGAVAGDCSLTGEGRLVSRERWCRRERAGEVCYVLF